MKNYIAAIIFIPLFTLFACTVSEKDKQVQAFPKKNQEANRCT